MGVWIPVLDGSLECWKPTKLKWCIMFVTASADRSRRTAFPTMGTHGAAPTPPHAFRMAVYPMAITVEGQKKRARRTDCNRRLLTTIALCNALPAGQTRGDFETDFVYYNHWIYLLRLVNALTPSHMSTGLVQSFEFVDPDRRIHCFVDWNHRGHSIRKLKALTPQNSSTNPFKFDFDSFNLTTKLD